MVRRTPTTSSALKGHRTNVVIEDDIYKAMDRNVGKGKRFATKGHCVNFCIAQVLGVQAT